MTIFSILSRTEQIIGEGEFFVVSPYAIFHIIGLLLVVAIIITFLRRQQYRSLTVYYFTLYLTSIFVWGLATVLQHSTRIHAAYEFFSSMAILGWIAIPVFYCIFVLYYTENERIIKGFLVNIVLFGSSIVFVYLAWRTNYIVDSSYEGALQTPWGLDSPGGKYLLLGLMWVVLIFFYSISKIVVRYRETTDPQLKKQILIFIPSTVIPLSSAIIIDGVLPQIGIQIYPLGFFVASILMFPMVNAIQKYSIFFFDKTIIEQNVIQKMNDAIIVADNMMEIRYANPGAEKLFQNNTKQLLALDLHDIMKPLKEISKKECRKYLETHAEIECETNTKFPIPIHFSISTIQDREKNSIGFILNIKNVQALKEQNKKLVTSKQRLRDILQKLSAKNAQDEALFQSIGEGIIATDTEGSILHINTQAEILFGKPLSSISGKKIWNELLFEKEDGSKILKNNNIIKKALDAKKRNKEIVYISKKYSERLTLLVTATPIINDDEIIGAVVVVRDITKEKDVDKMKTEFVSIVSHQLRTPITAMNWYLEEIANEEIGKLNQEQKEYMKEVMSSNKRMIKLINDLLNISRLESGRMTIAPKKTDMMKLTKDVMNEYSHHASSHNCSLQLQKNQKRFQAMDIDASLIHEVLANLISNAIKYSNSKKNVCVVNIILDQDEKNFIVQVQDTGVGIPEEEQQRLFTKFFRASNVSNLDVGGTGLGLYITKLIIEASGGKIWYESEEGKGTTFSFSLPLAGSRPRKGERSLA